MPKITTASCICFMILHIIHAFWIFDDSKNISGLMCNKGTKFECPCPICASALRRFSDINGTTESENNNEWLSVEFESCIRFDVREEWRLRTKLAEWVNEECAIVLNCAKLASMNLFLERDHIVIGGLKCIKPPPGRSILRLSAVYNKSGLLDDANRMHPSTLGEIVRSREHLLSAILSANIRTVFVDQVPIEIDDADYRIMAEDGRKRQPPFWHLVVYAMSALVSSFVVSVALICCVVLIVLNWRINWKRITRGTWIEVSPLHSVGSERIEGKSSLTHNSSAVSATAL